MAAAVHYYWTGFDPPSTYALEPGEFSDLGLGLELSGTFSVSPSGGVIVGSPDNLFDVGGRSLLLAEPRSDLSSFVVTEDDTLITIAGSRLGFARNGEVVDVISLPAEEMQAVRGMSGEILLFGGRRIAGGAPNRTLYAYNRGGQSRPILTAPDRIAAVASHGDLIYIAVGSVIFVHERAARTLTVSVALPDDLKIQSLAAGGNPESLFFTANNVLYRVVDGNIQHVGDDVGPTLEFADGMLYAMNAQASYIVRKRVISNYWDAWFLTVEFFYGLGRTFAEDALARLESIAR